jgi:hypothetical protein
MAIGILIGLLLGFLIGLAVAIGIAAAGGYDWQQIMHDWHIALVYRRHKAEIDQELEELRSG